MELFLLAGIASASAKAMRQKHDPTVTSAVTVDWVVLTAALVGLGMAVIATLSPAIDATADKIVGDLVDGAKR